MAKASDHNQRSQKSLRRMLQRVRNFRLKYPTPAYEREKLRETMKALYVR